MGFDAGRKPLGDLVGAQLERAEAFDVDVLELTQGTGGGISRIDEGVFAARAALPVESGEGLARQHDLTAHRDPLRGGPSGQRQRDGVDMAEVRAHVFAAAPVSPGGSDLQAAVLVDELHRGAVEFELADVFDRLFLAVEQTADPRVEGLELRRVHRVVQRQHGHAVFEGRKPLVAGGCAHMLCGGVREDELRPLGLELGELAEQGIVLGV